LALDKMRVVRRRRTLKACGTRFAVRVNAQRHKDVRLVDRSNALDQVTRRLGIERGVGTDHRLRSADAPIPWRCAVSFHSSAEARLSELDRTSGARRGARYGVRAALDVANIAIAHL